VARLIRSKGVGVYFITQNPADVPDTILGQLGNRIQHALRAFTAKDQRELKKAAETYRPNPRFDTESTIREVGTGEAVTSFLEAKGAPGIVERTLIRPPSSRLGPIEDDSRRAIVAASSLSGKYDTPLDRESAFERLAARAEAAAKEAEEAEAAVQAAKQAEEEFKAARRYEADMRKTTPAPRGKQQKTLGDAMTDALIKELGGTTGRKIVRGILGGIFKAR
jgi:DNA helicase HerA-like ATPase